LIANVLIESIFVDDFAQVRENLDGIRNRLAHPWLETIAECIEVAVGPYTRIAMR
jgi:hypothetical protein